MKCVVVSLFEGDYVLGLGALVNSLVKVGFQGPIYAGYRGELKGWAAQASGSGDQRELRLHNGVVVRFIKLDTHLHLTNCKPDFLARVWDERERAADAILYFDPDITVKCRWSFFEEWACRGVALCEEHLMNPMAEDHPLRLAWIEWAVSHGWKPIRINGSPLNGGFFGVSRDERSALDLWGEILQKIAEFTDLTKFQPTDRSDAFYATDQDALNVLSLIYPGKLSRVGPEGMDFIPGGFIMSHAAGKVKPWRKRYVSSAFGGIPPSRQDKSWFANTEGPIAVLSPSERRRAGRSLRIASAIGRFIGRS